MKTLTYLLMTVGFVLVLAGIVAVFSFDQSAELFSLVWWMIVGGWCFALAGMGIDMVHVFKMAKREAAYVFTSEADTAKEVERQITRI